MGRIRTIRPDFTMREPIGRLTRDERLLLILLWTYADDEGRGKGDHKLLAGVLFPYDRDVRGVICSWLGSLLRNDLICLYMVNGTVYFQVQGWKDDQKVDRPTMSSIESPTKESISDYHKYAARLALPTFHHHLLHAVKP